MHRGDAAPGRLEAAPEHEAEEPASRWLAHPPTRAQPAHEPCTTAYTGLPQARQSPRMERWPPRPAVPPYGRKPDGRDGGLVPCRTGDMSSCGKPGPSWPGTPPHDCEIREKREAQNLACSRVASAAAPSADQGYLGTNALTTGRWHSRPESAMASHRTGDRFTLSDWPWSAPSAGRKYPPDSARELRLFWWRGLAIRGSLGMAEAGGRWRRLGCGAC